jgi:hypothetical protein
MPHEVPAMNRLTTAGIGGSAGPGNGAPGFRTRGQAAPTAAPTRRLLRTQTVIRPVDPAVVCRLTRHLIECSVTSCDGSIATYWELVAELDWPQPPTAAAGQARTWTVYATAKAAEAAFLTGFTQPLVTIAEGATLLATSRGARARALTRARAAGTAPKIIYVARNRAQMYWPPHLRLFWAGRPGSGYPAAVRPHHGDRRV